MDCSTVNFIEMLLIATPFHLFGLSMVLRYTFTFITAHATGAIVIDKWLYRLAIMSITLISLSFGCLALAAAINCFLPEMSFLIGSLGTILYGIHYMVLIYLMFHRMQVVFEGSTFALSLSYIWTFRILYVVYLISLNVLLVGYFTGFFSDSVSLALILLVVVVSCYLMTSIIVIFIRKIQHVSRVIVQDSQDGKALIDAAVKAFLLTIASLASWFIADSWIALIPYFEHSQHFWFFGSLSLGADLLTSFLSIVFGFGCFEAVYKTVCSKCHTCCVRIFQKRIASDTQTVTRKQTTDLHPKFPSVNIVSPEECASGSFAIPSPSTA